jgi:prevent-host-death family protein
MSMMPLSEVKARLSEIADEVYRTHDRVQVTRNGREFVVIMSADDLESLEATIELLSDPAAMASIAEAEDELRRGEHTTLEEMRALMEQRRQDGR